MAKTSKPPIVVPLLHWPRDTATLTIGHIYQGVQIVPFLNCGTSVDNIRWKMSQYSGKVSTTECDAAILILYTFPQLQLVYVK